MGFTPTIGSNAFNNNNRSRFGANNGIPTTAKKSTEEQLAEAKKKYADVFLGKKSHEVRLNNKSLALKRGKFIGLAEQNKFALFESTRMIVAVPVDKLSKRLEQKLEDQIDKAKEIFTETGIGCDEVIEIPEEFEHKMVGLSNREKIKMFFFKKPKKGKKKKSKKDAESSKDEADSKEKDKVESDKKVDAAKEDSKESAEKKK